MQSGISRTMVLPIPIFLPTQLAVHKEFAGSGFGKISLIKTLEYLWNVNFHMHGYAIVFDCPNDSAEHFHHKFGFEYLYDHNRFICMFLPMKLWGNYLVNTQMDPAVVKTPISGFMFLILN
jgi:GNAT superfamily N-acetyltransferase